MSLTPLQHIHVYGHQLGNASDLVRTAAVILPFTVWFLVRNMAYVFFVVSLETYSDWRISSATARRHIDLYYKSEKCQYTVSSRIYFCLWLSFLTRYSHALGERCQQKRLIVYKYFAVTIDGRREIIELLFLCIKKLPRENNYRWLPVARVHSSYDKLILLPSSRGGFMLWAKEIWWIVVISLDDEWLVWWLVWGDSLGITAYSNV